MNIKSSEYTLIRMWLAFDASLTVAEIGKRLKQFRERYAR